MERTADDSDEEDHEGSLRMSLSAPLGDLINFDQVEFMSDGFSERKNSLGLIALLRTQKGMCETNGRRFRTGSRALPLFLLRDDNLHDVNAGRLPLIHRYSHRIPTRAARFGRSRPKMRVLASETSRTTARKRKCLPCVASQRSCRRGS